MRESKFAEISEANNMELEDAILDKVYRGYAQKPHIDGVRPSTYDLVIDKFEEQMPIGFDEHYFVIFNCKFSSRFYQYRDDVCIIDNHILAINQHAFSYNRRFKHVQLLPNLIGIRSMAFEYSDLEEIDIPDSVVAIAPCAFYNCKNLKYVSVSRKTLGVEDAFAGCFEIEFDYR